MTHRPCGECRELVPADTGCSHWKPGAKGLRRPSRASTRASGPAPTVAEFRRVMGGRW